MKKRILCLCLLLITTFGISSCGQNNHSGANADGIVTAYGGEPQNNLIPSNTNEVYGLRIVEMLYSGLTYVAADGSIELDLAEVLTTTDNKVWQVKLKDNLQWSDGTALTSDDFIDSWNYAAKTSNAQYTNNFYEVFAGYKELNKNKKVDTLSGLKRINDTEFQITLNAPTNDFREQMAYTGFWPVPNEALESADKLKAQGENPVASGPYKPTTSGTAWTHNKSFVSVKNVSYAGPREPQNGGITFKFYTKDTAGYADLLSDQLDVIDTIPGANLKTFEADLGDRAINEPKAAEQYATIPGYLEHFGFDEEGKLRRLAISQAIDRESIINNVLNGTKTIATDFVPIGLLGHSSDLTNKTNVVFNPTEAKANWAKAEAISKFGTEALQFLYNADTSSNKAMFEAVANSVANNLGIKVEPKPIATFSELLELEDTNKANGVIRYGYMAQYPSSYFFLQGQYATASSSNMSRYSNSQYDTLLSKISSATTDAGVQKYADEAQTLLMADLPSIPLWYENGLGGYSQNVSNVKFDNRGVVVYYAIKVNG